jgi:Asp-tRNA(Asn)/Glu-tRNA(Gln) amidotransferase A subunit family amidase
MTELHDLTVAEAARLVRDRHLAPIDLVDHLLARIERSQPTLKAFVTVDAEGRAGCR